MNAAATQAAAVLVIAMGLVGLAERGRTRARYIEAEHRAGARTEAPLQPRNKREKQRQGAADALRDGKRIDLNTATAEDLELLPRVGPAIAKRIVSHRRGAKRFQSVDDLAQVRGIGKRTVDQVRHLVTVTAKGPTKHPNRGAKRGRSPMPREPTR